MSGLQRFVRFIEAPNPRGLSTKQMFLENEDLKPVEAGRRLWRKRNFITFWIADGFNLNTWFIVSSSIIAGLSWWQAWLCVWIGYTVTGFFVAMGARPGAIYHIGFPVFARSSFGIFGSLWPVLNRAGMACVWTGVQSWIGGQCVTLLLRSLAPSYNNLPNSMPASSGTTTRDFVSFFLFILLHIPAVWFPVEKVRHLFTVKSIVAPIAGIAYFIWIIVKAHGIGPIVKQGGTASGSDLGWAMIDGIMSAIANFATLMCNASDFSRFANKPEAALWPQIIAIPMTFGIVSWVGVMVASASTVIYGEPIWNPLGMLTRMLDDTPYDSATRAGVFFISASFILAQLGTNIAANTISAGTDMTALAPRFLTIRRGGYIAVLVAFVMCPWQLLSSSNNFTTYLSAYSVFLSAIIGVMFCDYFLIRRGNMDIASLYSFSHKGYAWYNYGVNWRAYVAYICGIIPNAPGFGGAVGANKNIPIGATYLYRLNFFIGFFVSVSVYYVLTRYVSKVPSMELSGWHEQRGWEPEDMQSDAAITHMVYADGKAAKLDDDSDDKF